MLIINRLFFLILLEVRLVEPSEPSRATNRVGSLTHGPSRAGGGLVKHPYCGYFREIRAILCFYVFMYYPPKICIFMYFM